MRPRSPRWPRSTIALGLEAHKAGQYDVAIKELKRAYLLKRLPPLLLNIGATYRKMGDLDLALHFYKKYPWTRRRSRPRTGPTWRRRSRRSKARSRAAAKRRRSRLLPRRRRKKAASEEAPAPKKRAAMPQEWSHTVVDAAPPNIPLDVRVAMPIMKGVKVYVFYRGPGRVGLSAGVDEAARDGEGGAHSRRRDERKRRPILCRGARHAGPGGEELGEPDQPQHRDDRSQRAAADDRVARDLARSRRHPRRSRPRWRRRAAAPTATRKRRRSSPKARSTRESASVESGGGGDSGGHTLRWAGVGLMAGGVALVCAAGGMFYEAKVQSDAVGNDSQGGKFLFKDPNGDRRRR